jgi:hypothetical protein
VIQKGGPCYYPDSLVSRAAVAMNLYYAYSGRHSWNCYFNNSALVVQSDPSTTPNPSLPCALKSFVHVYLIECRLLVLQVMVRARTTDDLLRRRRESGRVVPIVEATQTKTTDDD